jgi:nucleoid-associated protein YgaU
VTTRRAVAAPARAAVLLAGCGCVVRGTWWLVRTPVETFAAPLLTHGPTALGTLPLETAVVGLSAIALVVCVLWSVGAALLTLAALAARALAPGGRHARLLTRAAERGCPATARRLVSAALGVALGAGIATPVLADNVPPSPTRVSGLALPDRATGTSLAATRHESIARRSAAAPAASRPWQRRLVVVRTGDSLWSIAQALLPAHATDAEVTEGWHRIHDANPSRIGVDPDLILPGTRLAVPRLTSPHRKDAP